MDKTKKVYGINYKWGQGIVMWDGIIYFNYKEAINALNNLIEKAAIINPNKKYNNTDDYSIIEYTLWSDE